MFNKLLKIFYKNNLSLFDLPIEIQKKFLKGFQNPRDDSERSYYQYRCQKKFYSKFYFYLVNCFSLIVLPVCVVIFFVKRNPNCLIREKNLLIGILKREKFILPDHLVCDKAQFHAYSEGSCLQLVDILYILKLILKFPFSGFFLLKVISKISYYRYFINKYNPDTIVTKNEYSYTSSIMTDFCNKNKVLHINVMHGEKLFTIWDSFFRFNKCFIWDEHYLKLFVKLKAPKSQFILFKPKYLYIKGCSSNENYADYKYYLANNTESEIKIISDIIMKFSTHNNSVKFRPHPISTNIQLLRKYIPEEYIENPNAISINDSIHNSKIVIGLYSTVLIQAYNSGKTVIIDDVSSKIRFEKLKNLDYIMFNKNYKLLSNYKYI